MCSAGDLILVDKFKYKDTQIGKHTFIVIDDENGEIQGVSYDFIGLLMSSFKDEDHRNRKLRYPGNFPIEASDENLDQNNPNFNPNNKSGYVKCDQLYLFKKDEIDFIKIGCLDDDVLKYIIKFIEELQIKLEIISDNINTET